MDTLIYYIDNLGPTIVRRLSSVVGDNFDVTDQTFRLMIRRRDGVAVLLDKEMTADPDEDTVSYQPDVGDFGDPGIYRAWIRVDFGGGVIQDTEEFNIAVWEHAPGEGVRTGGIWRAARALEPVAWDALRSYPDYGDPELQRVIDLAKLRVLGSAVPADDEDSLDPRVIDFIAKKVLAENVLYAAISFWTNQVVQQSARGNSDEVVTYPDRIRAAEEAIKRYRDDLDRQAGELPESNATYNAPALLNSGQMLTPGLDEYPAQPVTGYLAPYYWTRRY